MRIAACINFYNDADALRGCLETSAAFFDNIYCINAGPGGAKSTDGSIELCEQFGATVVFDDIQKGFGVIRSRLIHDCGCTWAFLLDADERFHHKAPVLHCEGVDKYPEVDKPNLSTFKLGAHDQGKALREMIAFIVSRTNLSSADAYQLCSLAVDFHVTQTVNGEKGVHGLLKKGLLF
jgi:hypothetical protein